MRGKAENEEGRKLKVTFFLEGEGFPRKPSPSAAFPSPPFFEPLMH